MVPKSRMDDARMDVDRMAKDVASTIRSVKMILPAAEVKFDQIKKVAATMTAKAQLEVAQDDVDRCKLEIDRLRKRIEHMVPREGLENLTFEIERQQAIMKDMVPKLDHDTALDEIKRLQAELNRSAKRIEEMVSRSEMQLFKTLPSEILKAELHRKVPADVLKLAESKIESQANVISQLQSMMADMVAKSQLSAAEAKHHRDE
eukprot:CAMPEP_0172197046 /NCGR_PEP_ID=MMETSP1050-20130122/27199_1 /TAXON_ID=233186 /ORGANISM="Cryptomonas curvata, Strain CCAP979/52" /LENGTH=203 /DNA_ID=CAMNT_0012873483 /DNA_START=1 /DNA_END=610 /DNA_ORIENTATION=+